MLGRNKMEGLDRLDRLDIYYHLVSTLGTKWDIAVSSSSLTNYKGNRVTTLDR